MSLWSLAPPLVLLIAGALGGKKSGGNDTPNNTPNNGGDDTPKNVPTADPAAESAACEAVATAHPAEYLGRTRPPGMSDADWYGQVAYWQAYPSAPPTPAPDDLVYGPALQRLKQCVKGKLDEQPKPPPYDPVPAPNPPNPGPVPPLPPLPPPPVPEPPKPAPKPVDPKPIDVPKPAPLPPVTEVPQPGGYYQIHGGDNLSLVASKAYGTAQGTPQNYARMVLINSAPYNQRFVRLDAKDKLFPEGRISFNPRFGKTFLAQWNDPAKGGEPGGTYAVIFIPPAP